jgi:hypothetical protein
MLQSLLFRVGQFFDSRLCIWVGIIFVAISVLTQKYTPRSSNVFDLDFGRVMIGAAGAGLLFQKIIPRATKGKTR